MTSVDEVPVMKCGTCGETGTGHMLQVVMAPYTYSDGTVAYHPHDFQQNGQVFYHNSCPADLHDQVAATNPDHAAAILKGI